MEPNPITEAEVHVCDVLMEGLGGGTPISIMRGEFNGVEVATLCFVTEAGLWPMAILLHRDMADDHFVPYWLMDDPLRSADPKDMLAAFEQLLADSAPKPEDQS